MSTHKPDIDKLIDQYNHLVDRYNRAIDPKPPWLTWLFPRPQWEIDELAAAIAVLEQQIDDAERET